MRRLPEWSLVGVVDASPERLRWAAAELPGVRCGESLSQLLPSLSPNAVLISTPPASHYALAAESLRSRAHVFIEKPMVLLPSDAVLLLQLAASVDRQIRVGFNRRFRPAYLAARQQLARQPEHSVHTLRFELSSNPQHWSSYSSQMAGPDAGGAVLEDIASHQLDLVPWLLGRSPNAVRARYARRDLLATVIELDLRFSDGWMASCLAGHQGRFVERLQIGNRSGQWIAGPAGLIRGGRLSAALGPRYLEARGVARAVARKLMGRPGDTLETFRRQLQDWARVLLSPATEPLEGVTGADGHAGASCVALVEACRHSLARNGAWVEVHTLTT